MDEYGQIGPEKGDYERDCRTVAHMLRKWGTVFVAFAANGTRMNLTLVHKGGLMTLGADAARPAGISGSAETTQWVLVVREEFGSYWFDLAGHIDPGYLQGKFDRCGEVDAEALTEFLLRVGVECQAWKAPA